MTPEETRDAADLMYSAASGVEIQVRHRFRRESAWVLDKDPLWNWDSCEYRQAPKKPVIIWDYAPQPQTCNPFDARKFVEATPEVVVLLKKAGLIDEE